MKFAKSTISLLTVLPMVAFAQGTNLDSILDLIDTILSAIIPILLTLAVIYFMWGLVQYIMSAGDDSKRKDGKFMMLWGIIALFVMVAVWGLVATVGNIVGVDQEAAPDTSNLIPDVN